jgi:CRP-like cAMP-binding protein
MEETTYLAGELVVREDDEGEELYVILEGEAKAIKNYGSSEQIELTTHSPSGICYFGEIAILDRARRSATVVVTQDARLLTLDGERFMELILQAPEISFEVFRVLIKRLRVAEGRIRLLIDEARPPSSDPSLS